MKRAPSVSGNNRYLLAGKHLTSPVIQFLFTTAFEASTSSIAAQRRLSCYLALLVASQPCLHSCSIASLASLYPRSGNTERNGFLHSEISFCGSYRPCSCPLSCICPVDHCILGYICIISGHDVCDRKLAYDCSCLQRVHLQRMLQRDSRIGRCWLRSRSG